VTEEFPHAQLHIQEARHGSGALALLLQLSSLFQRGVDGVHLLLALLAGGGEQCHRL